MVVFQDICGCPDELVTHIVAELSDVCLLISQAELICHPSVGFRFTQDSLFPDLIPYTKDASLNIAVPLQ